MSQPPQPGWLGAVPPYSTREGYAQGIGKNLGERLTLQAEIGTSIAHRGSYTRMAEQLKAARA